MPTEADTCRKFVVPKLQAAGWDNEPHSIAEKRTITDGRVVPFGKGFIRKPAKGVEYLLGYTRDFNLAVVEAKAAYKTAADAVQQARCDKPVLQFESVGRNEASMFTGLCSQHDTELFKVIDTEPLNVDNDEHLKLLAYRSVMQDLHTNIEQGNRLRSLHDELAKAAGRDPDRVSTPAFLCALEFYQKAQNSFRYRSKHFDRPIEEGRKPDLKHSVLELPNQAPVLAVSCLFSTIHSEQGHIIGPTLNVVPLTEKRTAVILSCPAEQENSVREALKTTCQAEDDRLRYEISKLIMQRVENFVLSPKHYNAWSADKRNRILEEFERTMTNPDAIQDHEDLVLF